MLTDVNLTSRLRDSYLTFGKSCVLFSARRPAVVADDFRCFSSYV
jgi:hypothetical protein